MQTKRTAVQKYTRECLQPYSSSVSACISCVPKPNLLKVPTPAVLPQPALTSNVLAPAVELKPSNAGVFTPPVAPKPFDAVKVPSQYTRAIDISPT